MEPYGPECFRAILTACFPQSFLGTKDDTCPKGRQQMAPKGIADLVERFEGNKESYKSGHYNETRRRREFVDPFFRALGWDMDNEQALRRLTRMSSTRMPSKWAAPPGHRLLLSHRRPDDIYPAFQLRR